MGPDGVPSATGLPSQPRPLPVEGRSRGRQPVPGAAAGLSSRWVALELVAAVLAAVAAVVVVCYVGRNTWFRLDAWEFLLRSHDGSLGSWLGPHNAHLQIVAVALHRLLYAAVGMDFWPWYYLPHALGHAALCFLLWRGLLKRGCDRAVAFTTYVVLLFLWAAAFLSSVAVGSLMVTALLLVVARRIDRDGEPTLLERLVVSAALLLMVASSTLGLAGLVACLAAVVIGRRLRWWWWCFLPAVVVYGGWFWVYGRGAGRSAIEWGGVLSVPGTAVRLLGLTVQHLTGLGGPTMVWGTMTTAGLAAGLGWLAWRRRLRPWDWVFVGTVAGYLLMVLMVRGASGYSINQMRYSYTLIMLAVPVLVPHLRFPKTWPAAGRIVILLLVGGSLLGYNGWRRVDLVDNIERGSLRGRAGVEAVAAVVAGGEPAIDDLRLRSDLAVPNAAVLEVSDVRELVADGWVPAPPDPTRVEAMRLPLRIHTADRAPEDASGIPLRLAGLREGGCLALDVGQSVSAEVVGAGWFTLTRSDTGGSGEVAVTWRDRFGEFSASFVVDKRLAVQLAVPVGETSLVVRNVSPGETWLCQAAGQVPGG